MRYTKKIHLRKRNEIEKDSLLIDGFQGMLLSLGSCPFAVLTGTLLISSLAHFPLCNSVVSIYLFFPGEFYIEHVALSPSYFIAGHIFSSAVWMRKTAPHGNLNWELGFVVKRCAIVLEKSSTSPWFRRLCILQRETKGNCVEVDLTVDISLPLIIHNAQWRTDGNKD